MTKFIVGTIQPIRARDVRWDRLIPAGLAPTTMVGDAAKVEQAHPITHAMRERLPLLSDGGLVALRAFLTTRDSSKNGSMSTPADVQAWIAMVDDETRRRARTRGMVLIDIIKMFSSTEET